jgi:hypothetical protein
VATSQIYKGGLAFIAIQLFMVTMVIAFPRLVVGDSPKPAVDLDKIQFEAPKPYGDEPAPMVPAPDAPAGATPAPDAQGEPAVDDPMEAVRRALRNEAKK